MRIKKPKEKHKYIFPNFVASAMKNTDMPTQMKSAMLSMFLLLVGMILMGIYSLIYFTQGWVFKGLILFNLIAGFLFITSYLVTTYQQYISYMNAMEIQTLDLNPNMPGQNRQIPIPSSSNGTTRKKNRPNQFLFFGGLVFIVLAVLSYFFLSSYLYVAYGLGLIGIICVVSVFFRKPNKTKAKLEPKLETYEPKKKFQKLPKQDITQKELNQKLQTNIDEINQQQELEQEELGITQAMNEAIETETQESDMSEPEPEQGTYVDYTKSFPLKKKKDGRTIYYT